VCVRSLANRQKIMDASRSVDLSSSDDTVHHRHRKPLLD
jgi:hypothetical protein